MPTPASHVIDLRRRFDDATPSCILAAVLGELFTGRVAVVSSFGADAAVLLHLVAAVDRATPVLFIDTGKHFPETLNYRDRLIDHFGLTGVRTIGPSADEVERLDPDSSRSEWDPDGCCAFRKVVPLEKALDGIEARITGRKRFQGGTRAGLPVFEVDGLRVKINPLAAWSAADIQVYSAGLGLPAHPLVAQGYSSIGCATCTSAVAPGEDARAGRWRGFEKTECGIHRPLHINQPPSGK